MRIMIDTNILISAFVFKSKIMNNLINKITLEHNLLISSYCIDELKELTKEKFKIDYVELERFLNSFPFELAYSPEIIETKLFDIRDEDDYIILHTAIIEDVDVFITGDKDFNDIKIDKPEILTAKEFLERY